jgi:uncharacterized membrane protein
MIGGAIGCLKAILFLSAGFFCGVCCLATALAGGG